MHASFRLLGTLILLLAARAPHAQTLILDEEFSATCKQLAAPVQRTLAPQTTVEFALINNPDINAFVTHENVIFIHSGLILKAKSAAEVQGVIAHELGHVAARHVFQRADQASRSSLGAVAGAVLGIGAAVAGAPQVGSAIMLGSQAGAISQILAFTRTQEQEADQHAISALHSAGLSAQGMVDMFTTLRTESQLSYNAPPAWLTTHPLPPERLSALQNATAQESPSQKATPTVNFARFQAKVAALTGAPTSVMRIYSTGDATARYARTIALINQGKLAEAEKLLTPLLQEAPADPFYQELSATLALQKGDLKKAITTLTPLAEKHPGWNILRYQLAQAQLANNQPKEALAHFTRITGAWPVWSEAWRGQGIAYGQLGRLAESHLALTESALAAGDALAAQQSLALAKSYLAKSPNADAQIWHDALAARLKPLLPTPGQR